MKIVTVTDYLSTLNAEIAHLLLEVRKIILKAIPDASEYVEKDMLAYALGANTYKNSICVLSGYTNHVTLGFINGIRLSDPDRLLEGEGKSARHIKMTPGKKINKTQITAWTKEAKELVKAK